MEELAIIARSGIKSPILLIDDIRCCLWPGLNWDKLVEEFGAGAKTFMIRVGVGWPSFSEILKAVEAISPDYSCVVFGDMLLAFDRKSTPVEVSPELEACTLSFLSQVQEVPLEKLLQAERVISRVNQDGFEGLQEIILNLSQYMEPWYYSHLSLWYGLALLYKRQYKKAETAFRRAKKGDCINHWRIDWYLAQALQGQNKHREAKSILSPISHFVKGLTPIRP